MAALHDLKHDAAHVATARPARLRTRSDALGVDVLRGIGHRGSCRCGWRGPRRGARSVAKEDARIHVASCKEALGLG